MARSNTEFAHRRVRLWLRRMVDLTIGLVVSAAILYVASVQAVTELRGADCPATSLVSIKALFAPCATQVNTRVADASR